MDPIPLEFGQLKAFPEPLMEPVRRAAESRPSSPNHSLPKPVEPLTPENGDSAEAEALALAVVVVAGKDTAVAKNAASLAFAFLSVAQTASA